MSEYRLPSYWTGEYDPNILESMRNEKGLTVTDKGDYWQAGDVVSSRIWSKAGHFQNALAKGPATTTWIWNLHADPHDFGIQQLSSAANTARMIFAVHLAHLFVVFLWLSGMHIHGAYFSNYEAWLTNPLTTYPSAQLVWPIVGQDALNADTSSNGQSLFQGIYITSGFFHLWRSEGITSLVQLKFIGWTGLLAAHLCLWGAYFHMHVATPMYSFFNKFKSLASHHLIVLFGLGSLSWAGHQNHVATPVQRILDAGVDLQSIPNPIEIIWHFGPFASILSQQFGYWHKASLLGTTGTVVNKAGSIFMTQITAHHLFVGIVFILAGAIASRLNVSTYPIVNVTRSWNAQLALNLTVTAALSITFAHHIYAIPVYPYLQADYATVMCLFVHHSWIAGFLFVGAGAHAAIYMVKDQDRGDLTYGKYAYTRSFIFNNILVHRDIITGHLIWVCIWLGMHAFGIYIHNDTMQALGRPEDMFSDSAIQLKPIFAILVQSLFLKFQQLSAIYGKVLRMPQELGTGDFMVHHIHAFTIHVTVLILVKGVLYARSSRFIPDKLDYGFRFPCDGPGRGGSCQVSPWDHVFLGVFWMYNSISVVIFHFFWKMQSDVWGTVNYQTLRVLHITGGDFSVNSTTINGWLRNFLWSQAAQVIQSYGTPLAGYGLIFLGAHFVWALSLMFLFSGRGYWQELIESIVWAHHKLHLVPMIQPRALSITQGRAVGLVHYILGGIGCTWSFFIARMVTLSTS